MCNNDCKCISDILKVINILQKNVVRHDECDNICDRRTLGRSSCQECNTRPVQLITCCKNGNDPLVMSTTKGPINGSTVFSSVFRVEKVDDCCATCRVLAQECPREVDGGEHHQKFVATDSFFTIDLKCVCAIKCLEDTFVDCL
ncbi:MAG: CotY/CotZ family spore coat protein [Bacilli bacterium]|jgi:spore coat protein Z